MMSLIPKLEAYGLVITTPTGGWFKSDGRQRSSAIVVLGSNEKERVGEPTIQVTLKAQRCIILGFIHYVNVMPLRQRAFS